MFVELRELLRSGAIRRHHVNKRSDELVLAWEKIICYTEGQGNAKKLLLYL